MNKYIVTGGGTGGHLYPGLSIAEALSEYGEVIYVASKNGNDRQIIDGQGINFPVKYWNLKGFERSFKPQAIIRNIINVFKLGVTCCKSIWLLLKFRPKTIVGVGGYISFPLVFFGKLFGAKTVIHEQNSFPGVTNRTLGKYVDNIMITYKSSSKYFPKEKQVLTSNPRIDQAVVYVDKQFHDLTAMNPKRTNILVVGGSLGAEKINQTIVELASKDTQKDFYLVTGSRYYEEFQSCERENLKILEYLDSPFEFFATADVVVTRGGATTLLELITMEKLTVVIPSPNVVANHQTTNAKEFSRECMLKQISEENLKIDCLEAVINDIIENEQFYKENIRKHKPHNAIGEIIKICK